MQLFEADDDEAAPSWTIAYVYEHPESDRIDGRDTPDAYSVGQSSGDEWEEDWNEWKSIYSYLPQAEWAFGRLPELNDETTLLTVQAYKRTDLDGVEINGAPFHDDAFVWRSTVKSDEVSEKAATTRAATGAIFYEQALYERDSNGDGCPGECGENDDGDERAPGVPLIDEDCNDPPRMPGESGYGEGCPDINNNGIPDFIEDDDEDGTVRGAVAYIEDSLGDSNNDGYPGAKDVDDDGDGLIDEDTNGYQPFLAGGSGSPLVLNTPCVDYQTILGCSFREDPVDPGCPVVSGVPRQTNNPSGGCKNPLYWKPEPLVAGAPPCTIETSNDCISNEPMDPFAAWDDDEDGLIDEDGNEDPLLVDLRSTEMSDDCAAGRNPYLPRTGSGAATMPGPERDDDCLPAIDADQDPWTYQVQYVYARTNPYWLLVGRKPDGSRQGLPAPRYYYYAPFTEPFDDTDGNGVYDDGEPYIDINGSGSFNEYPRDDDGGLPHVHPDCLPNPHFRGPQGEDVTSEKIDPLKPSDVHLIKRIVRMREDVENIEDDPANYIENVWLYRYDDVGFLKAVFDPAAVRTLIDAESGGGDAIAEPDDILKLADTYDVAGKPLIMYASQWYTYYNPYVEPVLDAQNHVVGIPPCYDTPPVVANCDGTDVLDSGDPDSRLPLNPCDGQALWEHDYSEEMEIDPDCSSLMKQNCGWCYARTRCGSNFFDNPDDCYDPACTCPEGFALSDGELAQLGIPGARPRFRKYLIKTARMRGADDEMHLYRFDYLGAANSVYEADGHITSYADPHNITLVDELVEQSEDELDSSLNQNEFYIYQEDFRLNLDAVAQRSATYAGGEYDATTHYLYVPVKVKSRRVVVMNYYGIAISDRTILTPGFDGDQSSLVDNQQYELINKRGQLKQLYDPSWVAGWREEGLNYIKSKGRVFVELFGGDGGWYSVFSGIAKGSGAGNLYNQQCKTPEVLADVPVQRVGKDQLVVTRVAKHRTRVPADHPIPGDLPEEEATYYEVLPGSELNFVSGIIDPAGTVLGVSGESACLENPTNMEPCNCGEPGCPDGNGQCYREDYLTGIDLHNQEPVVINVVPGIGGDEENDGVSHVRYDYAFYDSEERQVRWKWRWQEAVSAQNGGAGHTALEMWFYDKNGRERLYGRGAGTNSGSGHPDPIEPFLITYVGFDEYGRPDVMIEDFDMDRLAGVLPDGEEEFDLSDATFERYASGEAANRITKTVYNDLGTPRSRYVALPATDSDPTEPTNWGQVHRTDFKVIPNRTIRHKTDGHSTVEWEDPYIYQIQYDAVEGNSVYGVTTVQVLDKRWKPVEERIIAWNPARVNDSGGTTNMLDKIEDFGWGISLGDYTSDAAIAGMSAPPEDYWVGGCNGDCNQHVRDLLGDGTLEPQQPLEDPGDTTSYAWGTPDGEQIVTLARNLALYQQKSTLKPTQQITYSSFSEPATGGADRRQVVTEFAYDLEDRIARRKDADGTISRFLFDAKRRMTKIFRGSGDDCPDWFPPVYAAGDDDMVLAEQRLYNDGEEDCEHTKDPFDGSCFTGGPVVGANQNEDFPSDAGKLVRVRRFSDDAEACNSAYEPDAASRDTQYVYDWRGRPVIVRTLSVGYDGGTATSPHVVSVATTVYDNLDRPVISASWYPSAAPELSTVERWQETPPPAVVSEILGGVPPLALSRTLHDDRGRAFEERSYDPGKFGQRYTFSKTYRDDLDRAVAVVTESGMTTNEYDSLGRVVRTSFWTKEDENDLGHGGGLELTRSLYTYDAFDNVETHTYFDRKPGTYDPIADDNNVPDFDEAIVTYTYNSYDPAKRLIATADFGTNGDDGYHSGGPWLGYLSDSPPIWGSVGGSYGYKVGEDDLTGVAIVSRYGYDAAGRRIWSQDAKGIVTRSWYDLLGRTLLVAENWKDFTGTLAPAQDAPETSLTPSHTGPIRYTANHYTRGGLLDMKVAVIPSEPTAGFNLVPAGFGSGAPAAVEIAWTESGAEGDFTATAVDVSGAAVQGTRYVYGADVVNESKDAGGERDVVSTATNRVAQVWYPRALGADAGQPDSGNALKYKYTLDGQIARREDQRGVMIDFLYGTCEGCGGGYWPGEQLTRVEVAYPDDPPALGAVAQNVDHLAFRYNERGQLAGAAAYGPPGSVGLLNESRYTYGSFGMLASETLDPTGDSTYAKTVQYHREWVARGNVGSALNRQAQRLVGMTYPSGREVKFKYGMEDGPDDLINRAVSIEQDVSNSDSDSLLIAYTRTGGGRTVLKDQYGFVADFKQAGALDRFGRITTLFYDEDGVDDSGEVDFRQRFDYGYDANGNRTFSLVRQAGHTNDRSWLYGYDPLNRLVDAGYGKIDVSGAQPVFDTALVPTVTNWQLDLLGNWAGAPAGSYDSVRVFFDADGNRVPGPSEVTTFTDHHAPDAMNRIAERKYSKFDESGTLIDGATVNPMYDAAGNMTVDGERFPVYDGYKIYVYDAFNRLVEAKAPDNQTPGQYVTIATFAYDARGRLINRKVSNSGALNTDGVGDFFYYDGARDIEHHKSDAGDLLSLHRQYVYGLNYVDEVVAFNDSVADDDTEAYLHRVLQDANYNVVAVTDSGGEVEQQYTYSPYGERLTAENVEVDPITGDVTAVNPINLLTAQHTLLTQKGHQGLMHAPEFACVHNRNRILAPPFARFLQADQNGTGLIVLSSLGFHGATPMVSPALDLEIQYADESNIFNAYRNNPESNTDPTGLFTYADMLISAGIAGGLAGAAYSYSNFLDFDSKTGTQSNWRIAAAFAHGAGMGVGTALGFGWLAGTFASYAGVSIETAITSIGLMTSPAIFGLAVNEYESAETYQERLWAKINLAGAGLNVLLPHVAMFRVSSSEIMAGARPFKGTFKSFTKSNFRHNLKVRTRIDPGSRVHAHHVLPKELADRFNARGINVHEPRYGAWWPEHGHLSAHRLGYNNRWREYFYTHPNATAADLEGFGRTLARDYGFEIGF